MECADEVRQVAEADVEHDARDRVRLVSQQPRRPAYATPDQVLVRRHTEDPREESQEVEGTEADLAGDIADGEGLVRVGVDPNGRVDHAGAVLRARLRGSGCAAGRDLDDARGEQHRDLVEPDIALAIGGRSSELAKHDQLG
jgi:hypothetical protein